MPRVPPLLRGLNRQDLALNLLMDPTRAKRDDAPEKAIPSADARVLDGARPTMIPSISIPRRKAMKRAVTDVAAVAVLCGVLLSAGCKANEQEEKGKSAEKTETAAKTADAADLAAQAEKTARAFFDACAKEDWETAKAVAPGYFDKAEEVSYLKARYGGLEVVELGKAVKDTFKEGESKGLLYPGFYVPYKIRTRSDGVKEYRIAVRNDDPSGKWRVDGGI